jgi:hypothetical protein
MPDTFLGLEFAPLSLEHQETIEGFFQKYPQSLCDYTFACLYAWRHAYDYACTVFENDTLLIQRLDPRTKERHLLQPVGEMSERCQEWLLREIGKLSYPCKIFETSDQFVQRYPEFVKHFNDGLERSRSDYVYNAVDLATLAGRHYAKKRNLIHQAEQLYQWVVQPLTQECGQECFRILEALDRHNEQEAERSLEEELVALRELMGNFSRLKQRGCMISIERKPQAFAIFEPLNPTTAVIHFEKANREFKGLHQIINSASASAIHNSGYQFVNREDDLGIEGLRQAKMSYHPVQLVNSHTLVYVSPQSH